MAKKKEKKSNATDKGNSDDNGTAKKSGGGIVSTLLTGIVLGAASFGTVYMLPGNNPPLQPNPSEMHDQGHDDAKVLGLTVETGFLPLSPLTITLQDNSKILRIGITLETKAGEEDYIDPNDPKIRDAFMGYLRALRLEQIEDAAYMAQMRSQLLRRAKLILGPETVHGVLITDFLVR